MASSDLFASLLAASDFAGTTDLAATAPQQQVPPLPRATPKDISKNIQDAENKYAQQGYSQFHTPIRHDAERLNRIIAEVDAGLSASYPDKTIPSQSKLMLYDKGPYTDSAGNFLADKSDASVIMIPSKLLHESSDKNLKALVAHERVHAFVRVNPEMLKAYEPPNAKAVQDDFRKAGFEEPLAQNDERYIAYKEEMLVDKVALAATKDPEAYKAFMQNLLKKADVEYANKLAGQTHEALEWDAKKQGSPLTPFEVKLETDRQKLLAFEFDPHPSTPVRLEAIELETQALHKQAPAKTGPVQDMHRIEAPLAGPKPPQRAQQPPL